MSAYKNALKAKNRKTSFLLWFVPYVVFTGLLCFQVIGWGSIVVSPIVGLMACREQFVAALMNDEEVKKELEHIENQEL